MKKESTGSIQYSASLDWKPIPKTNLSAFRRVVKFKSGTYKITKIDDEGLAYTEELIKSDLDKFQVKKSLAYYLPKEILNIYRINGWAHEGEQPILKDYFKLSEKPYTNFNELNVVVNFYIDSHMMFDHLGEPYPVGIYYEYSMGAMDDYHYDLVKLRSYLSKRKDIHKLSYIEDIPYYNADEDRHKCISFIWSPTRGQYKKAWDYCKKNKKQYPSTYMKAAIEHLDLLGINKFKLRPKEQYYF